MREHSIAPVNSTALASVETRYRYNSDVLSLPAMVPAVIPLLLMMILAILGEETLLTPMNLLLFELIWIVPGFLLSEWTRSV